MFQPFHIMFPKRHFIAIWKDWIFFSSLLVICEEYASLKGLYLESWGSVIYFSCWMVLGEVKWWNTFFCNMSTGSVINVFVAIYHKEAPVKIYKNAVRFVYVSSLKVQITSVLHYFYIKYNVIFRNVSIIWFKFSLLLKHFLERI